MVRRNVFTRSLVLLLPLLGSATASAGVLTGNVATDLQAPPPGSDNWPVSVVTNPLNATVGELHVSQPAWMTADGRVSGLNINDMRLAYSKPNDTLLVGLNFFGIAGDADGNGVQGVADSTDGHGHPSNVIEKPGLGNESIWVQINYLDKNGNLHGIIAGVPPVGGPRGAGTDGFTTNIVQNVNSPNGFTNFGMPTPSLNMGNLLFDPSAAHPGFEFTLPNLTQLPGGIDISKGVWISAGAGSNADSLGEDAIPWTHIPSTQISPGFITPEPSTVIAWSLIVAGAAWRIRRRRATGV
jgi:MYXO-CTERM domain-containing protein